MLDVDSPVRSGDSVYSGMWIKLKIFLFFF
jgi:hypothetical protein